MGFDRDPGGLDRRFRGMLRQVVFVIGNEQILQLWRQLVIVVGYDTYRHIRRHNNLTIDEIGLRIRIC